MMARRVLTGTALVTIFWLILLVPACAPAAPPPTTAPVSGGTAESSPPPQPTEESGAAAGIATASADRTPIPTPTRTNIEQRAESMATRTGLSGRTFLGIPAVDWLELAGSLLLIVIGYFLASLLVNQILKRIIGRTKTKIDDEIFGEVDNELRWFVVLVISNFAVSGLSFLGDNLRTFVNDLFFLLMLILVTSITLGLIRIAANHFKANQTTQEDRKRLDPVITAVQRFADFVVLLVAASLGLGHFGVNTNTFFLILIIIGLIASLAARDIITDAISGFIILSDQPFRVGDSVHISELNTWGDVLDIGTRTTRIRTKDNRELIVPNSQVVKSQIMNYSYPDTKFRLQTDIGVAYGIDIDLVRKTATEAVRGVKGVLDDEPVDVLFTEFGDSARKVRVRWWIASFHDKWPALDAVHVALESAFEKAHIDMPYETYALRVHMEDGGGIVSPPKPPLSQESQKDDHA